MTVLLSCMGCAAALPAWAQLAIDSATWDGRRLSVEGTDGRGGTVDVFYTDYDAAGQPVLGDALGTASVRGNGSWTLRVNSNRNNPLDPVPCAVSATLAGDPPVVNFPVAGAPENCAPQPPAQNNPPVCSITGPADGQVFTLADGTVTVPFSATATDQDNDSLSATASFPNGTPDAAGPVDGTGNVTITQDVVYDTADVGTQTLSFTATEVGTDPALNCTASVTITIQEAQQQVCDIVVDPLSLDFGTVTLGASSTLATTVTNNGGAACNVTLGEPANTVFAVAPPLTFNVAPGGLQNVSVTYTPTQAGTDTDTLVVNSNDPDSPTVNVALTGTGAEAVVCVPADLDISINSTSQNGCPDGTIPQVAQVPNNDYSVLAINDLGMHCGDLDTRISSILPPFQVLLAQVIDRNADANKLNPPGVDVFYSAASNSNFADPILSSNVFDGVMANGDTYKTNFWDLDGPVENGSYDAFYPAFNPFDPTQTLTPLAGPPFNVGPDVGLPVPNVEHLYIGADGNVNSGDEELTAVLHAMPGIAAPYTANDPQRAEEHYTSKPFFVNFPFGYVAEGVNWYEGAGVPFAAFDDNGRENAYPLVRVEAKPVDVDGNVTGPTLSTVDTVLPISGEASCVNCHADPDDLQSVTGRTSNSTAPTDTLAAAGLPVALSIQDPDPDLPPRVSLEYAADINTLRLHDLTHGARYVNTACDGVPAGEDCVADPATSDPCVIPDPNSLTPENGSASCLTNLALEQNKPVVCQVCHYTPALDLAQLGPLAGPEGTVANGRNQMAHRSNSNVMHSHHGSLGVFPTIDAPIQDGLGGIENQGVRLTQLEESCYQCHPGTNVQCLRGAMFDGGMLCNDCHGDMLQVGADFSQNNSPSNAGVFTLDPTADFYDPNDPQPRVPWANEPGCGSCHTGDAVNNLAGDADKMANIRDTQGNIDNIRLRVAYRVNADGTPADAKATPIVPTNKRFAEPAIPDTFGTFTNPGANGLNPQLYRVSTGHGGVMCEGCHGATHAEFDSDAPALTNDDVTSQQLQGHVGTIADCTVCHAASPGNNLNGPHGLHRIAFDSTPWASPNVHRNPGENFGNCATCHGGTSENNSCGTVLSRVLADRNFSGNTILKGEKMGCAVCHNETFWNNTCVNQ